LAAAGPHTEHQHGQHHWKATEVGQHKKSEPQWTVALLYLTSSHRSSLKTTTKKGLGPQPLIDLIRESAVFYSISGQQLRG
jgi:hypothetical protein